MTVRKPFSRPPKGSQGAAIILLVFFGLIIAAIIFAQMFLLGR